MMSAEERFNLAQFLRLYVEHRLELMIKNAVEQLSGTSISDDDTITFTWNINLSGGQLKCILSGELEPHTAIKILTVSKTPLSPGDSIIHLDKEPQ